MMINTYNKLADLLEYPDSKWDSNAMADEPSLTEFHSAVAGLTLSELQELYTRTFDLNPVCALEIGYHLFGENYKRGEFLANLRETEAPFELGQENQLPDYLPVLLRLLKRLQDEELRGSLIGECLIPAIEKMLKSFNQTENPYRFLLHAVRSKLQTEAPQFAVEAPRFNMRANLPVLTENTGYFSDSGYPSRTESNWSGAPDLRAGLPEGQRPSAHQAAQPQTQGASAHHAAQPQARRPSAHQAAKAQGEPATR